MADNYPYPNDPHPDGTVVASVWYRDDDEFQLATILVLRPQSPFFRVGVWDLDKQEWDGNGVAYEDHMNIVPAINGEVVGWEDKGEFSEHKMGYIDMGGDY